LGTFGVPTWLALQRVGRCEMWSGLGTLRAIGKKARVCYGRRYCIEEGGGKWQTGEIGLGPLSSQFSGGMLGLFWVEFTGFALGTGGGGVGGFPTGGEWGAGRVEGITCWFSLRVGVNSCKEGKLERWG